MNEMRHRWEVEPECRSCHQEYMETFSLGILVEAIMAMLHLILVVVAVLGIWLPAFRWIGVIIALVNAAWIICLLVFGCKGNGFDMETWKKYFKQVCDKLS